ncbi:uncharacterized protein LOC132704983 [Cylas formicarius]|uniref:uncharacterized protein LOC132704983 n=1 Tax=Cylas formicarius TaxID=197179 RepID=UPI002958AA13|nr:uncharacterized protein LOC132704983 [Cylas formicarius]
MADQHLSWAMTTLLFLLRSRRATKCVVAVYVVAILTGYGYSAYGKQTKLYDQVNPVVRVIDHAAHVILTVSNLTVALQVARFRKLCDVLRSTVIDGKRRSRPRDKSRSVATFVAAFDCFIFVLLVGDVVFLLRAVGFAFLRYYIARDVQFYMFHVSLLLVMEVGIKIAAKFRDLNASLTRIEERYFSVDAVRVTDRVLLSRGKKMVCVYDPDAFLSGLTRLEALHNELCNVVDQYNERFGIVLLFAVMYIVANILWDVTVIMEYFIRNTRIGGTYIGYTVSINYGAWIVASLGQTILMAHVGHLLRTENQKTVVYCYSFLNKLPIDTNEGIITMVRSKLLLLAEQVRRRHPLIKAGGFIPVDLGILNVVVSNVATNTIVAVQFLFKL